MSKTWMGRALKKQKGKKMSFGPNYKNYFQGSPIPNPTSPYLVDYSSPTMTATEVIQRHQEAQAAMAQAMARAQQMQSITRQTTGMMMRGSLISITFGSGGGGYQIQEVDSPPPYQPPEWLTAMHTTIDTLHAKGI